MLKKHRSEEFLMDEKLMNEVPVTDADVKERLNLLDDVGREASWGLYTICRAQGYNVKRAWATVLSKLVPQFIFESGER